MKSSLPFKVARGKTVPFAEREHHRSMLALVLKIPDCNIFPCREKFVFVCVECVCHVCTHMWPWGWYWWHLLLFLLYIFETGSPPEPEAHWWGKTSQSVSPKNLLVSTSPSLGFQVHNTRLEHERVGDWSWWQVLLPAHSLCTPWAISPAHRVQQISYVTSLSKEQFCPREQF